MLVNYAVQQAAGWALIQIRAAFPTGHCLPTIELTMNIHTVEESHYKQSLREGIRQEEGLWKKSINDLKSWLLFVYYACKKNKRDSGCVRSGHFNYCQRDAREEYAQYVLLTFHCISSL